MMNKKMGAVPVLIVFSVVLMLLGGCKANTVPQTPAVTVETEKPSLVFKKRVRRSPSAESVALALQAKGKQQGGARQGVTLTLKRVVSTVAGRAGVQGSADGSATKARFDAPKGITTDGINLYLADLNNHTIRKIEIATGKVTTLAGMAGQKGSTDGKGSAARFNRPFGITTDDGNLYVSDSNNHCIRQIDIETGEVTTIAGEAGKVGYVDGDAKGARFFIPEGITTDGDNLYIADTHNHSVRKINLDSNLVTTLAGLSGAPGYGDEVGSKARFSYPKGIATDGHYLYVADFGNHHIRKVSISSGAVTTLTGADLDRSEKPGDDEARFNYPSGLTTDGRNLYVLDTFNRTVRKILLSGGGVSTLAGKAEMVGVSNGSGEAARFNELVGITTDGNDLFVTDSGSNTVRKIR